MIVLCSGEKRRPAKLEYIATGGRGGKCEKNKLDFPPASRTFFFLSSSPVSSVLPRLLGILLHSFFNVFYLLALLFFVFRVYGVRYDSIVLLLSELCDI